MGRGAQRQRRHVELRSVTVVVLAEREETLAVLADLAPAPGQVLLDEMKRERVVSRGHRRMRREHRGPPHFFQCVVERRALFDELADALQGDKRRMSLVQVPHGGFDAKRPQHAYAADAEDDLLLDACFAVAAVKPGGQLAIPRRVLLEIGVEQKQADPADAQPPNRREHGAIAERHRNHRRLTGPRDRRRNWRVGPVETLVMLLLPAVGGQPLMEVALRVHEPDADERHSKVARFLAVIAREHAKAAGVDRQRLMQCELGGEIGDHPSVEIGPVRRPPGAFGGARFVEAGDRFVVIGEKARILRRLGEPCRVDGAQHAHRVVRRRAPEPVIEAAKDLPGWRPPAPPKVEREFVKPVDTIG